MEMCQTAPTLTALHYLQTSLSSVVDHTDEHEASSFRACMAAVLSAPASHNCEVSMDEDVEGSLSSLDEADAKASERDPELYRRRHELFESVLEFVPDEMRQPKEDLRDVATRRELL
jgi:hypothetical protein